MNSPTSTRAKQSLQPNVAHKPDPNEHMTVQSTVNDGSVTITCHADFRWVQRAHEFYCRPCQAWSRAEPVVLQSNAFDCVRFDSQTETLLCVRDNMLVTVLSAEYERFTPKSETTATADEEGGSSVDRRSK